LEAKKAECGKRGCKLVKPCTQGLFKTMEYLGEMTHIRRIGRIIEAVRLRHVHLFLKITVKEDIVDIKFSNFPIVRYDKRKTMGMVVGLTTRLKVSS
jgi:hypothetical protein